MTESYSQSQGQIRTTIRQARRSMSKSQKQLFDLRIFRRLTSLKPFSQASSVGCYMASDGECETRSIIKHAISQSKSVYLPIVRLPHKIDFHSYQAHDALIINKWGLKEPIAQASNKISARKLNLVITPLVAFDPRGARIGMGGGFYDRAFAFKHRSPTPPLLIGLAYELQAQGRIELNTWDVKLDYIITEKRTIHCHQYR